MYSIHGHLVYILQLFTLKKIKLKIRIFNNNNKEYYGGLRLLSKAGNFLKLVSSWFINWAMFGDEWERTKPRPTLSLELCLERGTVYSELDAKRNKGKSYINKK